MTDEEMTTSLYESEAEQTRERIASTVDDLQNRLSPRNMMSGAVSSLQDQGYELLDSAKRFVRDYPIAVSLVGLSVGLLLLNRNRTMGHASYTAYDEASEPSDINNGYDATADDTGMMRRGWRTMKDTAGNTTSRLSDTASAARDFTSDKWSTARERTSEMASRAREAATRARQRTGESISSNPLGAALAGLAAGALIGFLLPRTRRENELLGETRDRLAEAARSAARAATEAGRQQLDQLGVNADNAKAKLGEIGQQAKEVARTATQAAAGEVKNRVSAGSNGQGTYNA